MKTKTTFNGKEYIQTKTRWKTKEEAKKEQRMYKRSNISAILDKRKDGYFLWVREPKIMKIGNVNVIRDSSGKLHYSEGTSKVKINEKGKIVEVKKKISKPSERLSKIEKEMMINMYYNDELPLKRFKSSIKYVTRSNPRDSTIEKHIKSLKKKGMIEGRWYSNIYAFRNKRFKEIHYGLTSKGFKKVKKLPRIVEEYNRKSREYKKG